MKSYIITLAISVLCLLSIGIANAQDNTMQTQLYKEFIPRYTIAVQPFYLLNGGLRFDYEQRLKNPKHWLQLSISGYYLSEREGSEDSYWETMNSNYDKIGGLKGIGLGGAYKFFNSKYIYYSGGLSYTYYRVSYSDQDYVKFIEDGLPKYEYSSFQDTQNFNKINANVCIGFQTSLQHRLFFDGYIGLGYSYSFYDESKPAFDSDIYGYGYRGLTVAGGFRVGFSLGK